MMRGVPPDQDEPRPDSGLEVASQSVQMLLVMAIIAGAAWALWSLLTR